MARSFKEQFNKDGTLGYIARAASAPVVGIVGVGESIVRGDLKAPIANKISDNAAQVGKTAEKAIVKHVSERPVQTVVQASSALIANHAIKKISDRVDRLEGNKK